MKTVRAATATASRAAARYAAGLGFLKDEKQSDGGPGGRFFALLPGVRFTMESEFTSEGFVGVGELARVARFGEATVGEAAVDAAPVALLAGLPHFSVLLLPLSPWAAMEPTSAHKTSGSDGWSTFLYLLRNWRAPEMPDESRWKRSMSSTARATMEESDALPMTSKLLRTASTVSG